MRASLGALPLAVACTKCGSEVGKPCVGNHRNRFHAERSRAYRNQAWGKPKAKPKPGARMIPETDYLVLVAGLKRLGMMSLGHYWASAHWRRTNLAYSASGLPKCCAVCTNPRWHLHHRSYKRLGQEWMTDLVPLCKDCHTATHKYLMSGHDGVTLWNAHKRLPTPSYAIRR